MDPIDDGDDRVDQAVRRFEQQYQTQDGIDLERYWADRARRGPLDEEHELACLSGLIKADLRRRFERGETPAVSGYLEAFPELQQVNNRMLSLLYEEYCLLEEHGDEPDPGSFCDRYPDWKDSIASQIKCHHIFGDAAGLPAPKSRFPEVGEIFEEFALKDLIGKGKYSRVFLANDLSLGGKRVVLKVSVDRGLEERAQGALDHPHIVPVNVVVFNTELGLRGLSMPLRAGLPLDEVIRRLREGGRRPDSARDVWDALAGGIAPKLLDATKEKLPAGPAGDGWREFPVDGTFAQAAAWIGLVLANALDYAHGCDTYHRDVKPGNVLLTLRHGPQLLDFNLSRSLHAPQLAAENLGGTLPYMAPEQIEAFLVPKRWDEVKAVADVYSLGLVLYELLTGQPPDLPDASLPPALAMSDLLDRRATLSTDVRRHDDRVPYALEAIVNKCLRPDPAARYAGGMQLAEDLDAFLRRRPLVHAVNPSRVERFADRAARNRRLLVANAFYLSILALLSPLLAEPASRLFLPPLNRSPAFKDAVGAVDDGDYARAVSLFSDLTRAYPREPLPYIYQSIAYSKATRLPEDPAIASCGQALTLPGVDDRLREWAREHPPFVAQLGEFGADSLVKIQDIVKHAHTPKEVETEAARSTMKSIGRVYDTVGHLMRNVLTVDATSKDAIQGLALVAEFHGDYGTAYDRCTELLKLAQARGGAVQPDDVASLRLQRARAASLRAGDLGVSNDPRKRLEALRLADDAIADLDLCATILADVQKPFYLSFRTAAMLTRGETHRRQGDGLRAKADAREAKTALEMWVAQAKASGAPVDEALERHYRGRIGDLWRNPYNAKPPVDDFSQPSNAPQPTE